VSNHPSGHYSIVQYLYAQRLYRIVQTLYTSRVAK